MNTNRRIALVVAALFITATLADVMSRVVFLTPVLSAPDYLAQIAAHQDQVLLGALLLFIGAAAAAGIAIALYPVLRKYDESSSLGAVGFRLIEGAFYLGIVVCLLLLVTLSKESADAGAVGSVAFQVQASLLMAARDALAEVAVLAFGLGAFLYYLVFYRSRLIPRWLSVWGLLGVVLLMISGLLVMVQVAAPMSTTQVVLALPIGAQEMVLAVWLITKGFDASAIAAESAAQMPPWPIVATTRPAS